MLLDEFDQFGGADACVPGRLVEIPELKQQASEQISHFNRLKCHHGKVMVLTLTIQLSSFTIMRLTYIPSA